MKRVITIVFLVAAIAVGAYFFRRYQLEQQRTEALASLQTEVVERGSLTAVVGATGVVRSNQSAVLVWQTSGTVEAVNVAVSHIVSAGEALAILKETSLAQNIILAKADLVNAQNALENVLDVELQRAQALQAVEDAENALEDIQDTALQITLAEKKVIDAEKTVDLAERRLRSLNLPGSESQIQAAESQVVLAEDVLNRAKEDFAPYENKSENDLVRATLQSKLAAAQQSYDAAFRKLNALKGTANDLDIRVAESDLSAAQAQLAQAQRDLEDAKIGPSEARLALLQAQLNAAKREYERLKDGADPDDVAAAEARIAATEATIALADLTAPFEATVTSVNSKPGDQVTPGSIAFKLDDLSRLLVDVDISEVDINRIQVGQDVQLSFDAVTDKTYNGKVVEVGVAGTTIQGIVSFRVTVELVDADEFVRPGMTAGVNIQVTQLENVLLVPNRAVRIRDGQRVVYIFPEGAVAPEPVNVTLGVSSDIYSEVVSGDLKEGDNVVLNPPTDLSSFFGPGGGF